MTINSLEKMIHRKIPLTKRMGLRVKSSSVRKVEFMLPLKPNVNHVGTAFGGTILACQAVSCWGWLLNFFEANGIEGAKVVLKSSTSAFKKPVESNFRVVCRGVGPQQQQKCRLDLLKKGRADLKITSEAANHAATFSGEYVILLSKKGSR